MKGTNLTVVTQTGNSAQAGNSYKQGFLAQTGNLLKTVIPTQTSLDLLCPYYTFAYYNFEALPKHCVLQIVNHSPYYHFTICDLVFHYLETTMCFTNCNSVHIINSQFVIWYSITWRQLLLEIWKNTYFGLREFKSSQWTVLYNLHYSP